MPVHTRHSLSQDLMDGVSRGLFLATAFSVLALIVIWLHGSATSAPQEFAPWRIVQFYCVAGVIGGLVFGLLRPIRTQYQGKLLTAYLILFLVYGGGTAAFLPYMNVPSGRTIPLRSLLLLWAALCAILAPIYVSMFSKK